MAHQKQTVGTDIDMNEFIVKAPFYVKETLKVWKEWKLRGNWLKRLKVESTSYLKPNDTVTALKIYLNGPHLGTAVARNEEKVSKPV